MIRKQMFLGFIHFCEKEIANNKDMVPRNSSSRITNTSPRA